MIVDNKYATPKQRRGYREIGAETDPGIRSELAKIGAIRSKLPLDRVFWSRVHQPDGDACWDWMGSRDRFGHGYVSHRGKMYATHRLALELTLGRPVSDVTQTCGRAICCKPEHLIEK